MCHLAVRQQQNVRYAPTGASSALKNSMTIIVVMCDFYSHSISYWCFHLIVVRRFEYTSDPEGYTSGNVATGRASLAGQVKG